MLGSSNSSPVIVKGDQQDSYVFSGIRNRVDDNPRIRLPFPRGLEGTVSGEEGLEALPFPSVVWFQGSEIR